MIVLDEQYGYREINKKIDFDPQDYKQDLKKPLYNKYFTQKKNGKGLCYELALNATEFNFKTSYFVGVDWILENKLPIYVQPKQNTETSEINFIAMLFEALKEPENFNHLDHLFEIDFSKPEIEIEQEQDLISPFLVIQFLHLLKKLVKKGLRKSYYPVVKNLNSKVRGKILVQETIRKNHFKRKLLHNYCRYEEYGANSIENRILKKALLFSLKVTQNFRGIDLNPLNEIYRYVQPSFDKVNDDVDLIDLKTYKPSPLFKEYKEALKLAKIILKRYGYSIKTINEEKVKTPPFWIDMSKLFELYVFKKLREAFPEKGEITYHKSFNRLEPDYILKSADGNFSMVVDAKYKPNYKDDCISKEDAWQVSGYARMKNVYDFLNIKDVHFNIDCLVIYSNQFLDNMTLERVKLKSNEEKNYVNIYKIGVKLPENKLKD